MWFPRLASHNYTALCTMAGIHGLLTHIICDSEECKALVHADPSHDFSVGNSLKFVARLIGFALLGGHAVGSK